MEQSDPPIERRSFLKWATQGLGALFAIVLGAPAIAYLIDARNRPAPAGGFRTVDGIRLSELEIGRPVQGVIRNVRRDAWTLYPNDVVGRVWVVKIADGAFRVFATVCPHLGCSINLNLPAGFACPCHGARFDLDGGPLDPHGNPAPRGMDSLEWMVDPHNADLLAVKYVNYYQLTEQKIPKQ